ncbi:hypothetical protein TELCIR_09392 [Teladorsagia circumcincta]|uniref:Uncharacterized protein n=1 Tax=Teladorsagia circumcincta TaxID=45464 RepID=A0A2G9UEY5_TELCI|nr:hypothetical protein TELCIR_09392 [Teladorsagia circumcincta]
MRNQLKPWFRLALTLSTHSHHSTLAAYRTNWPATQEPLCRV